MRHSVFTKLCLLFLAVLSASLWAPGLFAQVAPPAQQPPALQPPPGPPPSAQPSAYNCEPVNPNATPEARALLKTLCALSGKGILTGQHNFPNHLSRHSDKVFQITGKYPAVWGSDFGFLDGEEKD
jgi:hypothetical protein